MLRKWQMAGDNVTVGLKSITWVLRLIIFACWASWLGAEAQTVSWSKIQGPYSGSIQLLIVDEGGDIFATTFAAREEIYRSTDGGGNWQQVYSLLSYGYEPALAADSLDNVYYGDIQSGLFKSTDKGTSWFKTSLAGGASAVAAISGNRLCVGGQQTVSISNDAGKTWLVSQVRTDPGDASSIAEDSSGNLIAGFYRFFGYASYGGGIYISTDSGRTWQSFGMPSYSILSVVADKAGKIFALATSDNINNSIYSAVPKSSNWTQGVSGIPYGVNIAALQTDRFGEAVAVTDAGIFVYDDAASKWNGVTPPVSSASATSAVFDLNGNSYVGTDQDGVFVLHNLSTSWVQCGIFDASITSLVVDQSDSLYAGTGDGIYKYHPDAGTWTRASNGLKHGTVFSIKLSTYNQRLYAPTSDGLFFSNDGGNHWYILTGNWVYDIIEISEYNVFAGSTGGILYSLDGGATWDICRASACRSQVFTVCLMNMDLYMLAQHIMESSYRLTAEIFGRKWGFPRR